MTILTKKQERQLSGMTPKAAARRRATMVSERENVMRSRLRRDGVVVDFIGNHFYNFK